MRALAFLALAGCAAAAPAPKPAATASPLAAMLGALVCPEVEDRTFSLASGSDGVLDTYVRVNRCATTATGDELTIAADAHVWSAVDRAIGPVAVRSFVHGTLHVHERARVSARDDGQRLVVTLEPLASPEVAVETVGLLDLAPQDWASLIALELAPSAGVSPERVAKNKLNSEAERALRAALATSITVAYDARTGRAGLANAAPAAPSTTYRAAPHGSALVGPFPASATSARLRVHAGEIAVRPMCESHADHVRDADRRGDRVWTDDWTHVGEGIRSLTIPPMPCPWVLAMRADAVALVDVEPPVGADREGSAPDRWVALDELALEARPDDWYLSVVATTDSWREKVEASSDAHDTKIVVLAPDEQIHVRLLKQNGSKQEIEADAELDLATPGAHEQELVLTTKDGHAHVNARVRARVLKR